MFRSLWWRLSSLVRRRRLTHELDEELHGHYEELRRTLEDEGQSPTEAARSARLRLGGSLKIREASQDAWRFSAVEGFGQDLALALRSLRRRPGFFGGAVATLAMGLGASTAIFSVAYGVSVRPLPYATPDGLIRIYEANQAGGQPRHDVSERAFQGWREGSPSIEVAAFLEKPTARTVVRPFRERVTARSVTPTFFALLGIRPVVGPGFKREEEYTRFTAREVVLSHDAWGRLFNGSDVIGAPILFSTDDDEFRVVGVLPEHFAFGDPVDLWLPDLVDPSMSSNAGHDRDGQVIARLRPGASEARVRAELELVAARLGQKLPLVHGGWGVTVESLHQSIVGRFGQWTWLLFAAVVVVLLMACLNVGALLLGRAVARERETAVRVALGGSSWRLIRLWLAEALIITAVGAGAGLLFAALSVSALKAAAPPGIPRLDEVALDAPVLVLATLSVLLAVVGFALAPLRLRARASLTSGLQSGSLAAGDNRVRYAVRSAITAGQCAGAASLAIIAVMLTRSFLNLMAVDLGWEAGNVLSFQITPSVSAGPPAPARVEWADRLIGQLEATPGVSRAAVATHIPLSPAPYGATLARGRREVSTDERWPAVAHRVTDGYFEVMGMRLVAGRTFDASDRFSASQLNRDRGTPIVGSAIVTEETARTLWPGGSALGEIFWLPPGWTGSISYRVVGVVEDIQFYAVGEHPALHAFVPWTQENAWAAPHLLVKATRPAMPLVSSVRDVIRSVAPGTEINEVLPLEVAVARATAQPRFSTRLVMAFGTLALALAAVGIYGTLSYLVSARTREIGIRLALGASHRRVLSNVVWRGLAPAIGGGSAGIALALVVAQGFRSLFFMVEPVDLPSVATGALVLVVVTLVAATGPALRAAHIDPVRVLRTD
jgi:putative ABC transport system permease protein